MSARSFEIPLVIFPYQTPLFMAFLSQQSPGPPRAPRNCILASLFDSTSEPRVVLAIALPCRKDRKKLTWALILGIHTSLDGLGGGGGGGGPLGRGRLGELANALTSNTWAIILDESEVETDAG